MKKISILILMLLLSWTHSGTAQAIQTCFVTAKSGSGQGSLSWQASRILQDACDQALFTKMQAPLRVTLTEPIIFPGEPKAMISGANYGSDEPLAPLGVIIDARAIEGCAILIENPDQLSVKYLSFWVNHADRALCDFQGRSLLRQGSAGYVGDALAAEYYTSLQICAGPDNQQVCAQSPLPPKPAFPKGPDDIALSPKPPIPPGPDDIIPCADGDGDQVCDAQDLCDLSEDNPEKNALSATLAKQCPGVLIGQPEDTPLCSQSEDVDGDGLGNACDLDADGDGFSNESEQGWGSDPLDADDIPQIPSDEPNPPGKGGETGGSDPDPEPDPNSQRIIGACHLSSTASVTSHDASLWLLLALAPIFTLLFRRRET